MDSDRIGPDRVPACRIWKETEVRISRSDIIYLLVTGSLITSESESGRCLPLSPSPSSFYKHPKPVNESMEYDVVLAR
jgi:hypothetical protein